jgi:hypothetical protein
MAENGSVPFVARPKSERLRIRAALIVWARFAFVEPQ